MGVPLVLPAPGILNFDEKLIQYNQTKEKSYQISYSLGFSEYLPSNPMSLDTLVAIADQRMYEEKNRYKTK